MTDRDSVELEWSLPSRDDSSADAADAVDPRDVLERVDSLTVYAWDPPDDTDALVAHLSPPEEDVAERFADDCHRVTAGDVDGMCLAAIQGLRALAAEQQARLEAQEATIRAQRDDIESLRERLEALQVKIGSQRPSEE